MSNNNHSIYTAEDIAKYLSGKLTPAQMHAMEKDALDDPFLAEAMEGYDAMRGQDWQVQLTAAKLQLQEKENAAKVVPLYYGSSKNKWWKAVAAILVIGGLAALTYQLINKKAVNDPEVDIAKLDPVAGPDTVITTLKNDTPVVVVTKEVTTVAPPAVTKYYAKKPAVNTRQATPTPLTGTVNQDTKDRTDDIAKKQIVKPGEVKEPIVAYKPAIQEAAPSTVTPPVVSLEEHLKNRMQTTATDSIAKINVITAPQYSKAFAALVVGPDNTPLPFANITLKSENFGTYADVKGNFRLVSTDSLVVVEVRSVGYLPKIYTLNSSVNQNKIMLTEDISAFGKTVIKDNNTGKASRRATLLKDSIVNIEPADGWENYNTYVSNNIEIPEDLLKKDLHGEMEISFSIQPNGVISNIKVDKNGCDNCDEAAARKLIEQGPQWKLKKGKTGKARIKVRF